MFVRGLWFAGVVFAVCALGADDASIERAFAAWQGGARTNALAIISDLIKAEPKNSRAWNSRAQMRVHLEDLAGAVDDFSEAIKLEPDSPFLVQERAQLRFRLGQLDAALIDFDRANQLEPRMRAANWQRGIALYYAGRFADGRRQFELHQAVNPNDVENAAWHFLCVAREKDVAGARERLIRISDDSRVPMKEIHDLYAGMGKPDAVLKAAEAAAESPAEKKLQQFYADLYLGLYFEVTGDAAKSADHIRAAAKAAPRDHYMGDVARFHAGRLKP
jgi:lipoprotein NlpI